jgi:conjugal transfer pilus assembly protein TraW
MALGLFALFILPIQGNSTPDRLGPVYPIIEPDWLVYLPQQAEKRLRERPPTLSKEQLRLAIRRQMPGTDLPEVKVPRTYSIDPGVKVSQPVPDHTGKIVIPAGGRINPLNYLPAFRPIVILDGRKAQQVAWVREVIAKVNPLILITGGDAMELNMRLDVPVYPAPKALIERFSIERVPVILSQEDLQIKVEEVVP